MEWTMICKEFCKQYGFTYLFAKDYEIGFEYDGHLCHWDYEKMADYIRERG